MKAFTRRQFLGRTSLAGLGVGALAADLSGASRPARRAPEKGS